MKIKSIQELREFYGYPGGRAKIKVFNELEKHAIHFIETSPFLVMSTVGKQGELDASPRGGQPGFVKVVDNKTIIIPDSKGNNRLDSLTNIIETSSIGMLFLIPGVDETLRVNGSAEISTDTDYLKLFDAEKNPPKTCIVVSINEMFLHCAKAFMRSKLWDENSKIERSAFPSMGKMLKDQLKDDKPVETQEEMVKRYQKDL